MSNPDDQLATYYKSKAPALAGWDNKDVIAYAQARDPNFNKTAPIFYGGMDVNNSNRGDNPFRPTLPEKIANGVSGAIGGVADALNSVKIPVANELSKLGKAANDKIEPLVDKFDPSLGQFGLDRPLPESQAGVIGSALMYAISGTPQDSTPEKESISVPTKQITTVNPTTGLIGKTPVPDAEALANSDYISTPEAHGALAQSHVQSLSDGAKSNVDLQYNKLSDLVGANGALAQVPIDVSDASRIANEAPSDLMQHPDFQTAAMKKMRSLLAKEPQESNGVEVGPKAGSVVDWHEMEPSGTQMTAQEVVQLRKSLNKVYGSNYKNPTGNLAGQLIDSLDSSFSKDAPDILKEANERATNTAKDFYDTYKNKTVTKFLDASPEKAHSVALNSTDSLNALRDAGGDTALEHLRRSAGFDLYNDIVDKNMSSNDVLAQFRKNRALDGLFSDDQVSRFANIANSRLASIQAQIEGDPMSIGQKMLSAAKKAASSATGGAIGGVVGGIPGAITGAGAGAGLSDLIGK